MDKQYQPATMADAALEKLEALVAEGKAPDCYNVETGEYWFDWWADLPWDGEGQVVAMRHLLDNRCERLAAIEGQLVTLVGGMPVRKQLEGNLHDSEVLG